VQDPSDRVCPFEFDLYGNEQTKIAKACAGRACEGMGRPRMPTISGLRRRGYTPSAIRNFCARIGVAKSNSTVDISLLEHCIREELNQKAQRVMAVLRPLKLVIDNYPEGMVEEFLETSFCHLQRISDNQDEI